MTTRRDFILGLLATTSMTRIGVFICEDWVLINNSQWIIYPPNNSQWIIEDDSYLGRQFLSDPYTISYFSENGTDPETYSESQ